LQERRIQTVLAVLSRENHIPQNVCEDLQQAYVFFRKIENRLQEAADRQTHNLPANPDARIKLAFAMGFPDTASFLSVLQRYRESVHEHFNGLLGSDEHPGAPSTQGTDKMAQVWERTVGPEQRRSILEASGYQNPDEVSDFLDEFRKEVKTRPLGPEGQRRLDKLLPLVLAEAGKSDHPSSVLTRICDLIQSIERRINYLALLVENPSAIGHLVKLADAGPWIMSYLAAHPVLLDELLDPRTLYSPPEKADLERELRKKLSAIPADDLEDQIQELCIFKQVNTLRVAAADVTGVLPLMRVSDHLTEIAETILNVLREGRRHHASGRRRRAIFYPPGATVHPHPHDPDSGRQAVSNRSRHPNR